MNCCARIALVGEEEQTGIELSDARVEAVGEVVAAAQDVDVGLVLVGESNVRIDRDRRAAVGVGCREVDRVVFGGAAERRAAGTHSTDGAPPGRATTSGPMSR